MFDKCASTKYLINIHKRNYQGNSTYVVIFVLIFFVSSCDHNIYILVVARLFKDPDRYLEPYQTSAMECFFKKS